MRQEPPKTWAHHSLYQRVRDALFAAPLYFKSEINIIGVRATDIFTLNSSLGAAIEEQVVTTLNQIRTIWDPERQYADYSFVRRSQAFPDVILQRRQWIGDTDDPMPIILGIELKGWYLLAKEDEPSFRFKVTPAACNLQDLIAIYPWVLSQIISGSPRCLRPFVESARYAAEYRNYWWQHVRESEGDKRIDPPASAIPYPKKSDLISDEPRSDSGRNFGRFARTGIMDSYLADIAREPLCGIEARYWRDFFKVFREGSTAEVIERAMESVKIQIRDGYQGSSEEDIQALMGKLLEMAKMIMR